MTKLTYSDPTEGSASTGYHTFRTVEEGALLAEYQLADQLVPDVSDPAQLQQVGEAIQQIGEKLADGDGGLFE